MTADPAVRSAPRRPARIGLLAAAFAAGAVVASVAGGLRDHRPAVSFLTGEVRAVAIDGSSLCLARDREAKEVCAPPALIPGQQLPKVGDEVYAGRIIVRRSEDDSSRTSIYLFPDLSTGAR
jgi:hypothetical protein